jgi:hypothetical protein
VRYRRVSAKLNIMFRQYQFRLHTSFFYVLRCGKLHFEIYVKEKYSKWMKKIRSIGIDPTSQLTPYC